MLNNPCSAKNTSFDPSFEGRQHAVGPNSGFAPRPAGTDLSDWLSPGFPRHSRRLLFPRFVPHASTFLRPFAPRALPRFITTMGALTPEQAALRLDSQHEHRRTPLRSP